jgi:hypothetical protein
MKKFNTWGRQKNKCSISYNKKSPVVVQEIFLLLYFKTDSIYVLFVLTQKVPKKSRREK